MPTKSTVSLTVEQCAAAIVAMINHQPTSPRQGDIEAIVARVGTGARLLDLHLRIREAIAQAQVAEQLSLETDDAMGINSDDSKKAHALKDQRWAELRSLEAQLPDPPRSLEDVQMRAEIARYFADRTQDGRGVITDDVEGDCFQGPAARLVKAVLLHAENQQAG